MAEQLKHHKSIEEQIQLLKSRGLIIEDEGAAVEALERINYYKYYITQQDTSCTLR